jgi:Tol biopolymer transport system component
MTSPPGVPLGWSSDGTRLLIMRPGDREEHLFVLHADGSETQVTATPMEIRGATISPDGSRVVWAGSTQTRDIALYAADADGGRAELLREGQIGLIQQPTFSPDGTRIAYVDGAGDHSHSVWLMDADGSDAHRIVANETTLAAGHVHGLAWSPAGDRIAFELRDDAAIYTFAADGSDFNRVITDGDGLYWSPDGSRIAYTRGGRLAIADVDGSNVLRFGFGVAGPWHPGRLENDAGE